MPNRIVFALLLAAGIVYACGPRSNSSEANGNRTVNGPAIASSLDVKVGEEVSFVFNVSNNASRRLELTFPSGQTHEIVVLDSIGREIWRWSEGRMFTQALQNKVLDVNGTLRYDATWKPDAPTGRYVVVATLTSENHPLEQRLEFTVP